MSQVRKFNTGGSTSTSLFDAGGRYIDKDDFYYLAKKNKNALISNNGFSGDEAVAISGAYDDLLSSIEKGDIKSMDIQGNIIDPTGKFAKSNNDAYGKANALLGLIAVRMNTAKSPESDKKKRTDSKGILDTWNREFYGGNYQGSKSDLQMWNDLGEAGAMKELSRLIGIYRDLDLTNSNYDYLESSWKDKEEEISKLNKALELLDKGEYNNDLIRALMGIGMTSSQAMAMLLHETPDETKEETSEEKPSSREDIIEANLKLYLASNPGVDETLAREYLTKQYDDSINKANNELKTGLEDMKFNDWLTSTTDGFTEGKQSISEAPNFNFNNYFNEDNTSRLGLSWWNMFDNVMRKGHTRNLNDLYKTQSNMGKNAIRAMLLSSALEAYNNPNKENDYMKSLGNHLYLLKNYINYNKGYAWVYDAGNLQTIKMKFSDIQALLDLAKNWWKNNIVTHKKGGRLIPIIAMGASVTSIQNFMKKYRDAEAKKKSDAEKAELHEKAIDSGKTEEQFKHDSKSIKEFDITGSDGVRLGASIADLAGAIAAFVPGGSAVSLIEGIGADLARAGADYSDGATLGQASWNFAKGLGLTALSSLPIIGTGGKLGKAFKGIKTFLPYAFATYGSYATAGPAWESYKKIESGKGTLEDYTNILSFVTAATNGAKTVGNGFKAAKIKNVAKTDKTDITISGKNGKIHLKLDELETLKNCKTKAEMQEVLKGMPGHENDVINFSHIPGRNGLKATDYDHFWNAGANVTESPIYEWKRVANPRYSKDVAMLLFHMPSIFDKIHMPSMGYNPGKGFTEPVVTKPITKPTIKPEPVVADPDEILAGTVGAKHGGKLQFVLSHKTGGILKAENGTVTPILDPYQIAIWDYENRYRNAFDENGNLSLINRDDLQNTAGFTNDKYAVESNSGSNYNRKQSSLDLYKTLGEKILKNNNKFYDLLSHNEQLASKWAKRYIELNGQHNSVSKDWFDENGKFNYDNFQKSSRLWSDNMNGIGHDVYKGKVYYIDGQLGFYGDKLPEGYVVDPNDKGISDDGIITKYKLIKLDKSQNPQEGPEEVDKLQSANLYDLSNIKVPYTPNNYKITGELGELGHLIMANNANQQMFDLDSKLKVPLKINKYQIAPRDLTSFTLKLNGLQDLGLYESFGNRFKNSTSDSRTGFNGYLSSLSKGIQAKDTKFDLAQQYIQKYDDAAVPVVNANESELVDTNNYNNAMLTQLENNMILDLKSKLNTDFANKSAYLQSHILDWKQKAAEQQARQESVKPTILKTQIANQLAKNWTYNNAKQMVTKYTNEKNPEKAAQWKSLVDLIEAQAMTAYNNAMYGLYGYYSPIQSIVDYTTPDKVSSKKSGGTLEDNIQKARLKDNERFDKGILELIKDNRKAINNSTAITKAIINKVMSKF